MTDERETSPGFVGQQDPLVAVAFDLLDEVHPDWTEDPHMRDTPRRWARFWREFTQYDDTSPLTTFDTTQVDQMVAVTGIDVWSLCAHHLLPFSASISVGYIASTKVLGLSKFARIVHLAAHRPTSQEALCETVADEVTKATGSLDVAVTASGLHLCMAMRGIRTPATMTTSVTRGAFRDEAQTREEWAGVLARTTSPSFGR